VRVTQALEDAINTAFAAVGVQENTEAKQAMEVTLGKMAELLREFDTQAVAFNLVDGAKVVEQVRTAVVEVASKAYHKKQYNAKQAASSALAYISNLKVGQWPSRADRLANALEQIENGLADVEELKDEVESWRDNLPEGLQNGELYERLDECCSTLDDAYGEIESGKDNLGGVEFPSMYGG
jgi:hypothetical protein